MQWRDLVMITWSAPPALLAPLVPRGVTLDTWEERALISLVGLRWIDLAIGGMPVPGYQEFEQVNFRFYVRRTIGDNVRRGVVFIKQIVPSLTMSLGARLWFNENMVSTAMRHEIQAADNGWVQYEFLAAGEWNRVAATRNGAPFLPGADTLEAFIEERRYGYSSQRDGSTLEYSVDHPEWQIWKSVERTVECNVADVYGPKYVDALHTEPISHFIAVGSEATLHPGRRLPNEERRTKNQEPRT